MDTATCGPPSNVDTTTLVLSLWEAVSAEREASRVLQTAADSLVRAVPFDGLALFSLGDATISWPYVIGCPYRDGETPEEYLRRPEFGARVAIPDKRILSYDQLEAGRVFVCADLLEQETWFPHEQKLAASGVRSYAWLPLVARGSLIGAGLFMRLAPALFTRDQITLFEAASRPFAMAVGNAIANEEIVRLRQEMEAENLELKSQLGKAPWFQEIAGESVAMRRMLERVEQVATTDATVLITGETGTGKELVARAIHRRSRRARGPLVKVNCAAIPDTLLASELFGHERGAFTGATERRRGRFEQADGGTIFLDEIGDLPLTTQSTLLRILQEREFERLGGSQSIRVDVRVVAATNRHLQAEVRAARFRSDLFYRLNAFPIRLPPLRERAGDIPALVTHLASKYAARVGRPITRIDARSLRALVRHSWPGNVRELENVIERAVILSRDGKLRIDGDALPLADGSSPALDEQLNRAEREAIEAALLASAGRVSGPRGAALRLGLPPSTVEFRIRRLGIDKFSFHR
jgi:formate hydrogenlyase transcriptional activator